MRALRVASRKGAEISYEEMPAPDPGIGDVLIEVKAASFTPTELEWPSTWVDRAGHDRTPVVLGHEVSGVVRALGYGTTGFDPGDEVFGITGATCGNGRGGTAATGRGQCVGHS